MVEITAFNEVSVALWELFEAIITSNEGLRMSLLGSSFTFPLIAYRIENHRVGCWIQGNYFPVMNVEMKCQICGITRHTG